MKPFHEAMAEMAKDYPDVFKKAMAQLKKLGFIKSDGVIVSGKENAIRSVFERVAPGISRKVFFSE